MFYRLFWTSWTWVGISSVNWLVLLQLVLRVLETQLVILNYGLIQLSFDYFHILFLLLHMVVRQVNHLIIVVHALAEFTLGTRMPCLILRGAH